MVNHGDDHRLQRVREVATFQQYEPGIWYLGGAFGGGIQIDEGATAVMKRERRAVDLGQ